MRCRQDNQIVKDDVLCRSKCNDGDYWNDETNSCGGCADFWLKKDGAECKERCSDANGESYDRYKTLGKKCVTYYDILDKNAQTISFLRDR